MTLTPPAPFSEHIVFADESGDHGMGANIDPAYPMFVLAFCVFANRTTRVLLTNHDVLIGHSLPNPAKT